MIKNKSRENESYKVASDLFSNYLHGRAKLADKELSNANPYLKGNDNLMGRIGEFIAMIFLEAELNVDVLKAESKVDAHHDIRYKQKQWRNVNVKLITGENQNGQTTKITGNWDDLILIELSQKYELIRIGWMKREDFDKLPKSSDTPHARRNMLNPKGLMGRNNNVFTREQLKSKKKFAHLFSFEPKI